jgi:hypothetical protein
MMALNRKESLNYTDICSVFSDCEELDNNDSEG